MGLFEPEPSLTELERSGVLALRMAERVVSTYTHINSRRDFTQPQLLACLIVRGSRGLTYRGISRLLADAPGLRAVLGLRKVPHWTTLERTHNQPGMQEIIDRVLHELMLEIGGGQRPEVHEIAVDSTGLHATGASAYFEQRSGKSAAFVKLSVVVVCGLLLPASMVLSWGRSNDMCQGPEVVTKAAGSVRARVLYADRGYDGERLHELCREQLGIESYIPPVPKTRDGSIRTRHRSRMTRLPGRFGQRWQAEAFISALKRTTGAGLRARGTSRPLVEAAFRVLGYAIRR